MAPRNRLADLWKDPVGSNVIAALIIAFAGYLYLQLARASLPPVLNQPIARWIVPAVLLALVVLLLQRFRRRRKTLVFLSAGGTCRDPIAKVITAKLLEARKPRPRIDVRAAGLGPLSAREASYAARYVIREIYGQDLLKDHRPELLAPDLAARADLILAMDKSLLLTPGKTLPAGKSFLLKEFFGCQGDVVDPWPDGKDAATLDRYRACAEELRALLTEHIDRIVQVLNV